MTAIVGVLNKRGVAIAADSAVTMGNTHKVMNSANKIFTLSKYHPVAVMLYSRSTFMGVPWEIIIKEYRKNIDDRCFAHLNEYVDDFIRYLHLRDFFCDVAIQKENLIDSLNDLLHSFSDDICRETGKEEDDVSAEEVEQRAKDYLQHIKTQQGSVKFPDFSEYQLEDFKKYLFTEVESYAKQVGFSEVDLLCEILFYDAIFKTRNLPYTGLVFVGYGEEEIYPSLVAVNVYFGFDGKLKYYIDEEVHVSHRMRATIRPYAQTDVTHTIMSGISPTCREIIDNVIDFSLRDCIEKIVSTLEKDENTKMAADAVRNFDINEIRDEAIEIKNSESRESYTRPLIRTVSSLGLEDMANMAESFISLTSLVRRMQPREETVGGPVDVAVISKGDGFVWIKRKQYFRPELNAQFFNNYFRGKGLSDD